MEKSPLHEYVTAAIRYWEPRRVLYNIVLAGIVATYFAMAWPASKHALTTDAILFLFALAVLANVAYCAAYLVDVFAQMPNFRDRWISVRWIVFVVGVAFAAVLARFFSLSLFALP